MRGVSEPFSAFTSMGSPAALSVGRTSKLCLTWSGFQLGCSALAQAAVMSCFAFEVFPHSRQHWSWWSWAGPRPSCADGCLLTLKQPPCCASWHPASFPSCMCHHCDRAAVMDPCFRAVSYSRAFAHAIPASWDGRTILISIGASLSSSSILKMLPLQTGRSGSSNAASSVLGFLCPPPLFPSWHSC